MKDLLRSICDEAIRRGASFADTRVFESENTGIIRQDGRADKVAEILKEELSEYYLYTVDTRDTIPDGWSKRLPSLDTPKVPLASYYKFEKEVWGDQVMRFYRFTNSVPSKLGKEPLPDGAAGPLYWLP